MELRKTFAKLACVLLLLGTATPGQTDDGFRCPRTGRLVEVGETSAQVLASCGPPKSREDVTNRECTEQGHCFTVKVGEHWVYDFGRSYFVQHLLFREDRLSQIEGGDYGSAR